MNETLLKVEGMTCGHCVQAVKTALLSVPGVKSAEVSLEAQEAKVRHEGSLNLSAAQKAVAEEGYKVIL